MYFKVNPKHANKQNYYRNLSNLVNLHISDAEREHFWDFGYKLWSLLETVLIAAFGLSPLPPSALVRFIREGTVPLGQDCLNNTVRADQVKESLLWQELWLPTCRQIKKTSLHQLLSVIFVLYSISFSNFLHFLMWHLYLFCVKSIL